MGIVYYSNGGSPETWTEETSWIKFDISDSLTARTRILTITLSDPRNTSSTPYTAYKRVKIVERDTGSVVFLGRVDYSEPKYDEQYGQIILVYVSDYSRELFERKVDANYSGIDPITGSGTATPHKRSELVAHLVADYTYPGSVSWNAGNDVSGSSGTILKSYLKSGRNPAQIIEELASEDCWTDLTWGAAWRWNGSAWEDDTAYANSTGTPTFPILSSTSDYFYLGQNNPFLGAEYILSGVGNYGTGAITWEYWNGSAWTVVADIGPNTPYKWGGNGKVGIQIAANWTARTLVGVHGVTPPDLTSRYWLRCKAATVITPAQILQIVCIRGCGYDWYVNDSQVFQYFRRGSKPTGGPASNGLSIGLNVTETTTLRAMLGDYQFCDDPRETITRVTCYGTASSGATITGLASRSDLEAQLGIVKEKVDYVWGSNMSETALQTYVNDRAQMLLNTQSGTINRGSCKIFRYPYFGAGKTLVRVGDLIHVNIAPKGINTDYLVLQVKYSEPPGTTEFQLVSMVFGRAFSPFDLTSTLQGLTSGQDISVASARIQDLVVDNAKINTCSINKLTAGTLMFGGVLGPGGVWETATGGTRVQFDQNGIKAYNGANQTVGINAADGSGFFGSSTGSPITWNSSGVLTVPGGIVASGIIASNITVGDLAALRMTANVITAVNGSSLYINAARLYVTSSTVFYGGYTIDSSLTGLAVTFRQPTQPTGGKIGDIWVDTDAGDAMYTCYNAGPPSSWMRAFTQIDGGYITTGYINTNNCVVQSDVAGYNRIFIGWYPSLGTNLIAGFDSSNNAQFYIRADTGQAFCGGGSVVLDASGIRLFNGTTLLVTMNSAGIGITYNRQLVFGGGAYSNVGIFSYGGALTFTTADAGIDFAVNTMKRLGNTLPESSYVGYLGSGDHFWGGIYTNGIYCNGAHDLIFMLNNAGVARHVYPDWYGVYNFGSTSYWWGQVYASRYWGKNTTISSF